MTEPEKDQHTSRTRAFVLRGLTSPLLQPVKAILPQSFKDRVRNTIGAGHETTVDVGHGGKLSYGLSDNYWSHHGARVREYEPEMWFVADRFMKPDTIFVDCGANIGLWSVVAASRIKNKDQVIAVEPGSISKRLQQNHELNGGNFTILPNAVWDKSGVNVEFADSNNHASNSLLTTGVKSHLADAPRIKVQTVSVDDIVQEATKKAPQAANVVVKLDVEGVECEAVAGMRQTLARRNTLIVYEDHGNDPDSQTTAHLLKEGLNIYYINPDTLSVKPVHSAEELRPMKTEPTKGYNFIACATGSAFDNEFKALSVKAQEPSPPGFTDKARPENGRAR